MDKFFSIFSIKKNRRESLTSVDACCNWINICILCVMWLLINGKKKVNERKTKHMNKWEISWCAFLENFQRNYRSLCTCVHSLHQPRAASVIDAPDWVSRVGNLDSFAPSLFTHGSHKSSVRSLDPLARVHNRVIMLFREKEREICILIYIRFYSFASTA